MQHGGTAMGLTVLLACLTFCPREAYLPATCLLAGVPKPVRDGDDRPPAAALHLHPRPVEQEPSIVWQVSIGGRAEVVPHVKRSTGGTGWLPRIVRGLSAEREGGVFLCGSFFGDCSLDGRQLSSVGAADLFIGRIDEAGRVAWFERFGGRGTDHAIDVATDSRGDCVVTGMCSRGTRFGSSAVVTQGGSDAFTAKLGRDGAPLWVRLVGGPQADAGDEVCIDRMDNALVVGNTYGPVRAGDAQWPHGGGMDSFVLKYSGDGNLLWAVPITGPADVQGRGIAVDHEGNVLVVGEFSGTLAVGSARLTAAGDRRDVFVLRLSPSGRLDWAERFGAEGEDYARGVGFDSGGNALVTGVFSGQVAFGRTRLQAGGGENLFLLRLTPAGEVVWVTGMAGPGQGHGCEIEIAPDDCAVVLGDLMGTLKIGDTAISSTGRRDTFVACFDPGGRLSWVKTMRGTGMQAGFDIAVAASGRVTIAGGFTGELNADGRQLSGGADMESFVIAMDPWPNGTEPPAAPTP